MTVKLAGDLAQALASGTRNRLSQIEQRNIFPLAEILRLEKFGQADDLRALSGGAAHMRNRTLKIFFRLWSARHLHHANMKIAFQPSSPRQC